MEMTKHFLTALKQQHHLEQNSSLGSLIYLSSFFKDKTGSAYFAVGFKM
jgi:hypothetical protein